MNLVHAELYIALSARFGHFGSGGEGGDCIVTGQRVLFTLSELSRTITYLFTSRTHGIVFRLS